MLTYYLPLPPIRGLGRLLELPVHFIQQFFRLLGMPLHIPFIRFLRIEDSLPSLPREALSSREVRMPRAGNVAFGSLCHGYRSNKE